jgi:hypothetical protein
VAAAAQRALQGLVGHDRRICASCSQPVALTTKQPASSAWWRMVTPICSAKIGPTSEPGNCAQWICSCWAISA